MNDIVVDRTPYRNECHYKCNSALYEILIIQQRNGNLGYANGRTKLLTHLVQASAATNMQARRQPRAWFIEILIDNKSQWLKQHLFPSTLIRLSVFSSNYCHYTEHFNLTYLILYSFNCVILNYFYWLANLLLNICRLNIFRLCNS